MSAATIRERLPFEQWDHARTVRVEVGKALRGEEADLPLVAQFLDELIALNAYGEEGDGGGDLSPEQEAAHRERMAETLKARGLALPTWKRITVPPSDASIGTDDERRCHALHMQNDRLDRVLPVPSRQQEVEDAAFCWYCGRAERGRLLLRLYGPRLRLVQARSSVDVKAWCCAGASCEARWLSHDPTGRNV